MWELIVGTKCSPISQICGALAFLVVFPPLCCTATSKKKWQSPKRPKTRFSGHINSHLLRTMAIMTKQMALPYMWGWTQQLHLVVDQASATLFQPQPMNGLCSYLMMMIDHLTHLVVRPLCLSLY